MPTLVSSDQNWRGQSRRTSDLVGRCLDSQMAPYTAPYA
jgi:hypothetical protein